MSSLVFDSVFGDFLYPEERNPATTTESNIPSFFSGVETIDEDLLRQWASIRVPPSFLFEEYVDIETQCQHAYVLLTLTIERLKAILGSLTTALNIEQAEIVSADARALFAHTLPLQQFENVLSFVLLIIGSRLIGISLGEQFILEGLPENQTELCNMLDQLIMGIRQVGLGGDQAAQAYAQAVDNLLDLLIHEKMHNLGLASWSQGDAESYIANHFVPSIQRLMMPFESSGGNVVRSNEKTKPSDISNSSLMPEVQFWVTRAMEKMAKIMSKRLYDLILDGRVEEDASLATDLQNITSTPTARGYVAVELHRQLSWRLLHPGSSTVSILDAYIQFIWALRRIDKSGVLLVRTAQDITNFLHTRDDSVRIVILSLLEAGKEDNGHPRESSENFSGRVAKLMEDAIEANAVFGTAYYPGKDQKDINWEPEPIDAFTGYRSARYRDAMGHMVTIKEKDVFIDELRTLLGERLLKADGLSSWKEQRLLAMFKDRFEDFPIRECEIMVKDMQDSHNYHSTVAERQSISSEAAKDFQVKVLSSTYWPTLRDEKFELPRPMKQQIDDYGKEFQNIKKHRQLEWMNALGRVTVQLDLEDRSISEEVTTWQAAVIYQFDEDEMGRVPSAQPGTRSVADIEAATQMDEDLIRLALTFWVGKLVLLESITYPDTFTILEHLSNTSSASNDQDHLGALSSIAAAAAAAAQQAETEAAAAELKTAADLLAENAPLYTAFVVNMLTNQGHMPASRMMMMLKMLVAGGFPFEEAEFVEFLQGLAAEGRIEKAGSLWMVRKG